MFQMLNAKNFKTFDGNALIIVDSLIIGPAIWITN